MTGNPRVQGESDWTMFLLAGGIGLAAVSAGALLAAGFVDGELFGSGRAWPQSHQLVPVLRNLVTHPDTPALDYLFRSKALPAASPVLYWGLVALLVMAVAVPAVLIWRMARAGQRADREDPTLIEGLADRHQVKAAAGPKALLRRSATLRPSLEHPGPADVGYRLGTSRGVECWTSVEDSMVILGPPRSGKGYHLVIPAILLAPGAVVTTSTRPDNLTATLRTREAMGPVAVFDPQGLASGIRSSLRWSPVRGCEQPQTAMLRAAALCSESASGTENSGFWKQQTITAVRCLLHAAAIGNRPPVDLYRWSLSPAHAKEASEILKTSASAAPAWDMALGGIVSAEGRQRDSVWAMVSNAFAALGDPQVLEAVSPGPGERFDPALFLRKRGTLYLLGTSSGTSASANLVAALVEDLVDVARRTAATSPGARLDPPVGLILDEAANYALPSLGALMSEGGGTGITTMAVLQSLAQARDRWGREMAQAIWDSAIAKVILGGLANADDLADISRLIGDRPHREVSTTRQAAGGRSTSEATRQRPVMEASELRAISPGHGLLLLRAAKPIMMTLQPWTARRDATSLQAHRVSVEADLRAGARARWGHA